MGVRDHKRPNKEPSEFSQGKGRTFFRARDGCAYKYSTIKIRKGEKRNLKMNYVSGIGLHSFFFSDRDI